jgi:hypothetical protein
VRGNTYEARRAERRYKAVDPDNRVVTRTLEHEWEDRLRELEEVQRDYARSRREKRADLTAEDHARIRALGRDLPAVFRAITTTAAERKAMLRLVIEAISLTPLEVPQRATRVRVQWQSGNVSEFQVDRPGRQRMRTPQTAERRIRELAQEGLRDEEIARQLDGEGVVTGQGKAWNVYSVRWARRRCGIELVAPDLPRRLPLPDRHPDGRYSVAGAARLLGVSTNVVRTFIKRGLVTAQRAPCWPYQNVWWLQLDDTDVARLKNPPVGPSRGNHR